MVATMRGTTLAEQARGSVATRGRRRSKMSVGTILLIILILILIGAIPTWPHSREWGYGPSGGVGTIVLIVLILVLMGVI